MLAYVLALIVGFASFSLYMAAFFFPEVHRKFDLVWSGIGMFYALVLWVCAGRITGGLLLGQTASVAMLGWFGWQNLKMRRELTPAAQQTVISDESKTWLTRLNSVVQRLLAVPERAPQAAGSLDAAKPTSTPFGWLRRRSPQPSDAPQARRGRKARADASSTPAGDDSETLPIEFQAELLSVSDRLPLNQSQDQVDTITEAELIEESGLQDGVESDGMDALAIPSEAVSAVVTDEGTEAIAPPESSYSEDVAEQADIEADLAETTPPLSSEASLPIAENQQPDMLFSEPEWSGSNGFQTHVDHTGPGEMNGRFANGNGEMRVDEDVLVGADTTDQAFDDDTTEHLSAADPGFEAEADVQPIVDEVSAADPGFEALADAALPLEREDGQTDDGSNSTELAMDGDDTGGDDAVGNDIAADGATESLSQQSVDTDAHSFENDAVEIDDTLSEEWSQLPEPLFNPGLDDADLSVTDDLSDQSASSEESSDHADPERWKDIEPPRSRTKVIPKFPEDDEDWF